MLLTVVFSVLLACACSSSMAQFRETLVQRDVSPEEIYESVVPFGTPNFPNSDRKRPDKFVWDAFKGSGHMLRAYLDLKKANNGRANHYFHARGNYRASKLGPGGHWASEKISNTVEFFDKTFKGATEEDSDKDQAANRWGRSGGDPNVFRTDDLPEDFRK